MSIPELIASGSPDSDSHLLQALNTAEEEIATLREQRDKLLKTCKNMEYWFGDAGDAAMMEGPSLAILTARRVILEVEGEK